MRMGVVAGQSSRLFALAIAITCLFNGMVTQVCRRALICFVIKAKRQKTRPATSLVERPQRIQRRLPQVLAQADVQNH